jgi:hypothetical protein
MGLVLGECGRETTPGNTGSGRERGGGCTYGTAESSVTLTAGKRERWGHTDKMAKHCRRCSDLQLTVYQLLVRVSL